MSSRSRSRRDAGRGGSRPARRPDRADDAVRGVPLVAALLRGLFDVTKTPQIEIADTLGLMQSQAIESRDRALRVTLNGRWGHKRCRRASSSTTWAPECSISRSHGATFRRGRRRSRGRARDARHPAQLVRRHRSQIRVSTPMSSSEWRIGILYDRDGTAEYFSSIAALSRNACSSRSSNAAPTKLTAPPTRSIRLAAQARSRL